MILKEFLFMAILIFVGCIGYTFSNRIKSIFLIAAIIGGLMMIDLSYRITYENASGYFEEESDNNVLPADSNRDH